jgi:hypothetical protein
VKTGPGSTTGYPGYCAGVGLAGRRSQFCDLSRRAGRVDSLARWPVGLPGLSSGGVGWVRAPSSHARSQSARPKRGSARAASPPQRGFDRVLRLGLLSGQLVANRYWSGAEPAAEINPNVVRVVIDDCSCLQRPDLTFPTDHPDLVHRTRLPAPHQWRNYSPVLGGNPVKRCTDRRAACGSE